MLASVHFFRKTLNILKSPCVDIALFGDSSVKCKFECFIQRHPRFPLMRCKKWGVALLELPRTFEDYLREHKDARKRRNKCIKLGYRFGLIEPEDYLEDILAINGSSPERQGTTVRKEYLEPDLVRSYFDQICGTIAGIFREDGVLVAYHHFTICGGACVSNRIFGHADHLRSGIMYYLMTESVRLLIDFRNKNGYPIWTMYDTIWGASQGMLRFKTRLGYESYNVNWIWEESVSHKKIPSRERLSSGQPSLIS